jgi:pimeloyl-ACP methyl ester carboxylesterase
MRPWSLVCLLAASRRGACATPPPERLVDTAEWIQVERGVHLRVQTRTRRPGAPVLLYQPFAMAWPQIGPTGDPIFLPLLDTFTLVSFDPRAVGRSTGGRFDHRTLEHDLVEVARYAARRHAGDDASAARSPPVYALGISSSAATTIRVAARHPRLFAGILLVAPMLSYAESAHLYARAIETVWGVPQWLYPRLPLLLQLTLCLLRTPYAACHERWLCSGEFYHPLSYAGAPELYPHPVWTYLRAGVGMVGAVADPDFSAAHAEVMHVTRLDTPVHMLWGARDLIFATLCDEYATRLRAPEVRVTVVENASHAVHLEDAEAFRGAARRLVEAARRGILAPTPGVEAASDDGATASWDVALLLGAASGVWWMWRRW